jgi:hypothetical protein
MVSNGPNRRISRERRQAHSRQSAVLTEEQHWAHLRPLTAGLRSCAGPIQLEGDRQCELRRNIGPIRDRWQNISGALLGPFKVIGSAN